MPSSENTVSVTTAPPRMVPKSSATSVTSGISAFRSACFIVTLRSLSPFARAVRT